MMMGKGGMDKGKKSQGGMNKSKGGKGKGKGGKGWFHWGKGKGKGKGGKKRKLGSNGDGLDRQLGSVSQTVQMTEDQQQHDLQESTTTDVIQQHDSQVSRGFIRNRQHNDDGN